ncbi:hypothetical protein QR680_003992 [Steinernema hermaphroditum]|uniref:N-acetyltransferase ESCO acetyl-transferase domain-containing protein n=1 Tax=Steinernema hermaphroditum TaxID=289476 RepID=A0AA39HND2_9BILA|nr:hypothetical protein QR680_003992 [Steinernema hermaphroditum]
MQTRLSQFFQVPQTSTENRKRKETVFGLPGPSSSAQKRVKLSRRPNSRGKDVGNVLEEEPMERVTSAQIESWKRKAFFTETSSGTLFRLVPESAVKTLKQKFEYFVETVVNDELGYTKDLPLWPRDGERVGWMYVHVEKSTAFLAGVLIVDLINEARFHDSAKVATGTFLGINRIWTHRSVRRRGIARLLLDEARRSLPYLHSTIPRQSVAFSEPSVDGTKLARTYCRSEDAANDDFLVYDIK